MLSAARLPQIRAEACISLQASWEQVNSSNCPNHVRRTKSSIKKRIIVRRTVRSMLGEQTLAQLRTGLRLIPMFPKVHIIIIMYSRYQLVFCWTIQYSSCSISARILLNDRVIIWSIRGNHNKASCFDERSGILYKLVFYWTIGLL